MTDFADFQQLDEGEGNPLETAATSNDDPFGMAMGGMSMAPQNDDVMSPPSAMVVDDYTPEERAIIESVREEEDRRKRALYEKQQQEQTDKQ